MFESIELSDNSIYLQGTLSADNFTLDNNYDLNIISGNGNVEYGYGYLDSLDLSNVSVEEVVDYSLAQTTEGGAIFDVGNGERVFDYLTLEDGSEILFENIESIVFADETVDLTIDPNDPGFDSQWNLHMMGMQNAWRFTTGSDDVLIGVQDTGLGVDYNGNFHEDIRADETWFYSDDNDNNGIYDNLADDFFREFTGESQTNSHGTAVQGIIGAASDNGVGIAGINWNSDVYNIDVLDGNTGDLSLAQATQSMIDFANSQGQNLVINMSLGGGEIEPAFEALVAENQDNVLFVIASGNDGHLGEGISTPAILAQEYDNVIAVGASWGLLDENGLETIPGQRIEYDYWGSQYGEGLTLMGPSEVLTTDATTTEGFTYNYLFNGTSAATPNVSGVASLVWSANGDLDATEVKEILSETAYDLGETGDDIYYGHGFVNADAAVRRAIAI
jgi:serine protease